MTGPLLQAARDALQTVDGRVNPQLVEAILEPAVREQCIQSSYDAEVNIAVLKHYQMLPLQFNFDIVQLILAKAMMQLPARDFTMALFMIPESYYSPTMKPAVTTVPGEGEHEIAKMHSQNVRRPAIGPNLEVLVNAESLLQSCQFVEFWKLVRNDLKLNFLDGVAGFEETIRDYVIRIVGLSHRGIGKALLASLLGLSPTSPEFEQITNQHGWVSGPGDEALRRPTTNQPRPKKLEMSAEALKACIKAVSS